MGAFNTIWENPGDLEVADLYTIEMDYNSYRERAEEWDDFGSYETFLRLTEGFPDLHYLHTGDELKLCGLQIKVLSAYDKEITNSLTSDLANDGSLMFKVTNKEESMLFCADVGVKISDSIIAGLQRDLKSDYLQMGAPWKRRTVGRILSSRGTKGGLFRRAGLAYESGRSGKYLDNTPEPCIDGEHGSQNLCVFYGPESDSIKVMK